MRIGREWVDRFVLAVWAERFEEIVHKGARRGESLARAVLAEVGTLQNQTTERRPNASAV